MAEYIGKYSTSGDVQTAVDNGELLKPYVALVGNEIDWNSKSETDWSTIPLTFEILSDGNIIWVGEGGSTKTIEYSKDNGNTWTSITSNVFGVSIPVVSGDTIQFRGNNTQLGGPGLTPYSHFKSSNVQFNVKGNIMSLLDETNFSTMTTLPSTYTFVGLFNNNTGLIDASKLILPATTLTERCYYRMFEFCRNLNYIKCLATDKSASNCTGNWVNQVQTSGTFVKKAGVTWPSGSSGIPNNWTVIEE